MTSFSLVTTFFVSLLGICSAAIDFCDADPRLEVRTASCPKAEKPSLLLHIRRLDGNPYHSLHDSLWPVAHYLAHCTKSFPHGSVTFVVHGAGLFDGKGCTGDDPLPTRGPYWGFCAVRALAARVGGEVVGDLSDELPPGCFDKTVEFAVHQYVSKQVHGVGVMRDDFRAMSFYGRVCAGDIDKECDPNVKNRSMLVPLPARTKGAALKYLRESMIRLTDASLPSETPGRKIRVLMYDRNDTSRRQWVNTQPIHQRLQNDDSVLVRFVRKTPKSLKGQIELYAWPDVIVGPHGAAMVNTIFMREGTEVVEGRKLCDEYVGRDRFFPGDWTGWHGPVLNINVQYVQCHRAEGKYKERHQLLDGQHGPPTNGMHKYRPEEVIELLETALERQTVRLRDMYSDNLDPIRLQVSSFVSSFASDDRLKWTSRVSALVFGPLCLTLFAMHKIVTTRKKPLHDV